MDFATYEEAYAYAQGKADETGMDYGLRWSVRLLPVKKHNRFGWGLTCQVVRPTNPPAGYWER